MRLLSVVNIFITISATCKIQSLRFELISSVLITIQFSCNLTKCRLVNSHQSIDKEQPIDTSSYSRRNEYSLTISRLNCGSLSTSLGLSWKHMHLTQEWLHQSTHPESVTTLRHTLCSLPMPISTVCMRGTSNSNNKVRLLLRPNCDKKLTLYLIIIYIYVNFKPPPIVGSNYSRQKTPVPAEQKYAWEPQMVIMFWRREKCVPLPLGFFSPDRPANSLGAIIDRTLQNFCCTIYDIPMW